VRAPGIPPRRSRPQHRLPLLGRYFDHGGSLPAKTGVYVARGIVLCALVLLAACPRNITDSGLVLTVSPPSANLFVADTTRFSATLRDQDGNPVDAEFTWSSDNTSVATISGTGTARAVGEGSARIHVLARGEEASATISVAVDNGQTLTISPPAASLLVNETEQLTATLKDRNGNDMPASPVWSSNNPGIVSVTGSGVVRGETAGSATVQARVGNLVANVPIVVTARASVAVLVGAGDIATCTLQGDEKTAALLDGISGDVFTAGDNAYPNGSPAEFASCYGNSWGRHKGRTHPALGNHEYNTLGASGYFEYFGAKAGDPTKGYYSYELGPWHIVVLNSNIGMNAGSAQEQWLRSDLAMHPTRCVLAVWHHPRFSSGEHGNNAGTQPVWQALYDAGADVVVTGHDHLYERFAPQNGAGELDRSRGIRQFIVGTGGAEMYSFIKIQPNSEVRNNETFGVLKLTLYTDRYEWRFMPVAGSSFTDNGSASCH
jgi:hypothetical protein